MENKETKKTLKEYFNELLELEQVKENQDLVDFINSRIEILDKKNSSKRGPTKVQIENEKIKEQILESLSAEIGKRASEIANENNISINKATALLKQLVASDLVVRVENKRVVTFVKRV